MPNLASIAPLSSPPRDVLLQNVGPHNLAVQSFRLKLLGALRVTWIMLRNAVISVTCVGLMTFYCSCGNVFSRQSLAGQSYGSFLVATELWCESTFVVIIVITETVGLMKERFLVAPTRRPTFVFCACRLIRRLWLQVLLFLSAAAGTSILLNFVAPLSLRRFRLDTYLLCIFCHACFTHSIVATRQVFKLETVRGSERAARHSRPNHPWKYSRAFCRTFVEHIHNFFSFIFATGFVHITSEINLTSQRSVLTYTALSLVFKLLAQETARIVLLRRRVNDIRTMAIIVGMPTVLIDTQVRIVIQRMQSFSFSVVGTVGLAISEIALRLVKVLILKVQIRRQHRRASIAMPSASVPTIAELPVQYEEQAARTMDEWKKQVLTYHIAELYADMLAEYIAAGTALAVVAFYSDHPKYQLRKATAEGIESTLTQNGLSSRQLSLFTLQIVVEIIVDYVSCVITIRHGIRFDSITKYAAFITAAFVSLAALNIQISALMYLDITG